MRKCLILSIIVTITTAVPAFAWDGYDYDSGSYIDIEKRKLGS